MHLCTAHSAEGLVVANGTLHTHSVGRATLSVSVRGLYVGETGLCREICVEGHVTNHSHVTNLVTRRVDFECASVEPEGREQCVLLGQSPRSTDEIVAYENTRPNTLVLGRNDCWTFSDELTSFDQSVRAVVSERATAQNRYQFHSFIYNKQHGHS